MILQHRPTRFVIPVLLGCVAPALVMAEPTNTEETMLVTAEKELKQQPGVSIITRDDISKTPPINDLADIIRKMPGVNLTGNSASGSRGNNRQIDLRGMGPENTLILIDGRPVNSRDAVRYTWDGERDTRGDTNWVPVEAVERIEVIRGPAAARYGSGAAGGVVNIITRRPSDDWQGSLSLYGNQPEDGKEGATRRTSFNLSGPLVGDTLTMRLYGGINKTDADSWNINSQQNGSSAAGREGVRNRDMNALLSWKLTPTQIIDFEAGYSRQGNIYSGDTQFSSATDNTTTLAKSRTETNRLYRQNYALTYNGFWAWGQSKLGLSFDRTNNTRLAEGLWGRSEGTILDDSQYNTSRLKNYRVNGELNIPLDYPAEQTFTIGAEWNREQLNDPGSSSFGPGDDPDLQNDSILGISIDPTKRSSKNSAEMSAVYLEDNIEAVPGTVIIPGVRFDYHSKFGGNFSPSLNIQQALGEMFSLKAGIARAFKAPNLYQSTPGYLLYSYGYGCPLTMQNEPCYLIGNPDLSPEISINKEVGIEFKHQSYSATLTWFRNDYKNKIVAGTRLYGKTASDTTITRWENGGKAVVQGVEASFDIPLIVDKLDWRTNATYMIESKNKQTGNPLSIIPKYTVNTLLDWQMTENLSANVNWTMYGKQKPMTRATNWLSAEKGLSQREIASYSVTGVGVGYTITKNLSVNAGISNLFDKRVYRMADGASSYNERGRAYYAGMTASF